MPLVAQWFWLGLRYRSLTLPSLVNPAIDTGGLAGESKGDCLSLIASQHATWVASTHPVPPGKRADDERRAADLTFPLIAKPDIGWCGYGVRRIDTPDDLQAYAAEFPADATYLLQEFIAGPLEGGLFYIRHPDDGHGRLVAIAVRHQPQVTGDGVSSVADLAQRDPRLAGKPVPPTLSARIPKPGETVLLTTVASLRVGGRYEDGSHLHTAELEARIDAIARSMGGFYFGRFDIRCTGAPALQAGDFQIIEVNGAGSEAIQFWDPSLSLFKAYSGVFRKQAELFELAAVFRKRGQRPVGVVALSKAWLAQQRLIRQYPESN